MRNSIIWPPPKALFSKYVFQSQAPIIPALMNSPHSHPDSTHLSQNSDAAEVAKFEAAAHRFWDVDGEFKPLHKLNPGARALCAGARELSSRRACSMWVAAADCCPNRWRARAQPSRRSTSHPRMVETARLHALDSGLTIDYRVQSAEMLLASHAGKFDVVTCMEMLEHVPDPSLTIEVLAKLARPGGDIFISTINRNFKSFALAIVGAEYLAKLVPRGTHEYERLLKPSEIARFARAAGLAVSRHRRAQIRSGARAVLTQPGSFRELPDAPEASARGPHVTRVIKGSVVRSRRHPARHRAGFHGSAERRARRGTSPAPFPRNRALPGFARRACAGAVGFRRAAAGGTRGDAHAPAQSLPAATGQTHRAVRRRRRDARPNSNAAACTGASSPTSRAGSPTRCWSR